jgi:hypothetical protein
MAEMEKVTEPNGKNITQLIVLNLLGGKCGRCVELTTLPASYAVV